MKKLLLTLGTVAAVAAPVASVVACGSIEKQGTMKLEDANKILEGTGYSFDQKNFDSLKTWQKSILTSGYEVVAKISGNQTTGTHTSTDFMIVLKGGNTGKINVTQKDENDDNSFFDNKNEHFWAFNSAKVITAKEGLWGTPGEYARILQENKEDVTAIIFVQGSKTGQITFEFDGVEKVKAKQGTALVTTGSLNETNFSFALGHGEAGATKIEQETKLNYA